MSVIHIGPNSYLKKKIWKEYQTKKFHQDVTLICDDGTTVANKLFLAAQSKVSYFGYILIEVVQLCRAYIEIMRTRNSHSLPLCLS